MRLCLSGVQVEWVTIEADSRFSPVNLYGLGELPANPHTHTDTNTARRKSLSHCTPTVCLLFHWLMALIADPGKGLSLKCLPHDVLTCERRWETSARRFSIFDATHESQTCNYVWCTFMHFNERRKDERKWMAHFLQRAADRGSTSSLLHKLYRTLSPPFFVFPHVSLCVPSFLTAKEVRIVVQDSSELRW